MTPTPADAIRLGATVGSVMSREVVCVRPELSLETFEGLMLDRGLSGAPVVDADGALVGYAAASDVVRLVHDGAEATGDEQPPYHPDDPGEHRPLPLGWGFHDLPELVTVGDVMHAVPIELHESCTIAEAARVMVAQKVHRVPVVTPSHHVVGLVTSLDLLTHVANGLSGRPSVVEAAQAVPMLAPAAPAGPARLAPQQASTDETLEVPAVLPGGAGLSCVINPDGTLRQASAYFCALLGQSEHELVGRDWLDLVHAEDRALARSVSEHVELRIVRSDGTVRWLDWRVSPATGGARVCRAHDITPRHLAEARLVTQLRVATLLGAAKTTGAGLGAGLETICASEHWSLGRLWWVVPTGDALRLLVEWRAPGASVGGRTAHSLPRNAGIAGEAWGNGQARWQSDGTPDAKGARHGACAIPLRIDGAIVGVLELGADAARPYDRQGEDAVTQLGGQLAQFVSRKLAGARVEGEPRTAQELKLGRVDRLAALGSLAGSVAHQINNSLTYVRLSLGRLVSLELSRRPLTPVRMHRMELLQEVREGVGRIEGVVGSLKKISGLDDGPEEGVDVRALIDEVVDVAGHEMRHRAKVVCEHHPVPLVRGRKGALRQVFLNLLLNAAQAIPEGEAHLNEICISTRLDPEGHVVVAVSDTGAGIPAESLERIFEPFFTTRPSGQGLGLGLKVCKDVVSSLGGTITAQSTLGHGATIRVTLRPAEHTTTPLEITEASPPVVVGTDLRARILIIDDDRAVASSLALALYPHEVVVAGSGREALGLLRKDQAFDLILCDLMMPEVTGMDVHDAFRLVEPALVDKFVFMTGGAFTARAQRFLDEVSPPVLDKPFSPRELLAFVHNALRDKVPERAPSADHQATNGSSDRDRLS